MEEGSNRSLHFFVTDDESMKMQQGFPILLCYPKPSVMIKKDESDAWTPSLEDINSGLYDYVKLHRLSTSFDIGLQPPFCLHASFNGAFLLPALPEFLPIENAANSFNKLLGQIAIGGIYYESISPNEIDRGLLYTTGYFRGFGTPHGSFAQIQATIQGKMAGPVHSIDLLYPKFIYASELHAAFKAGKNIIGKIQNLSSELVLKGVSAFVGRAWSESLSSFWICAEQIISHVWSASVLGAPGIDIPGRKDFLKDNRTWTTSTKIELLFSKGLIDAETYALLNIARKARNDLVHKGDWPTSEEVAASLDGVFRLISSVVYGTPTKMNEVVDGFKKHGSADAKMPHRPSEPIRVDETDAVWLGPLPPIPGEKEWGDKDFEKVFEDKKDQKSANH